MANECEKLAEILQCMTDGSHRTIATEGLATTIREAIQEVTIPLADFDGVQQKLIEELYQKVEALETENAALSRQQSVISGKVEGLEKRLGKVQGAALYITEATP